MRFIHSFYRILVLLLLYTAVRFLFLYLNWATVAHETAGDLVVAFLKGARFDISILLMLNAPFLLIWWLPFKALDRQPWRAMIHWLYVIYNSYFFILNVADIELINFNARRMTVSYFLLKQDIFNQLPQLILHYWYLTLFELAGILIIAFCYSRTPISEIKFNIKNSLGYLVTFVFCGLLVFVGIRGGTQNRPINEAHAFTHSVALGQLILNTPFTMIHSYDQKPVKPPVFMPDDEARRLVLAGPPPTGDAESEHEIKFERPKTPSNVVVLILESFSREYMGEINHRKGYTPFLDKLADQSLFCVNNFANARRSIEGIPAVLSGLPSLLSEPFLMSNFQSAELRGIPQSLTGHGYETAFFHGADNGSMFFDSFASRIGFQKYVGRNEYPEKDKDWDGFWGIFDEPFLQFFKTRLSEMKPPFFSALFTLSSHQPYTIPDQFKGKFPKGDLDIHESIGYSDYALSQFFAAAEKEPWFENTLFILTADHTQKSNDPGYANLLGPFRTPMIIYKKGASWAGQKLTRVTQQADVPATVLDYLGITDENLRPLGHSMFHAGPGAFVARNSESFIFHSAKCTLRMTVGGELLPVDGESTCSTAQKNYLKAYVQYFSNGVFNNAW